MSALFRRSERIALQRPLTLVYHNELGHTVRVPAETSTVSCHGAGLLTRLECPSGTQVYMIDRSAGVGFWGRVVWQGQEAAGVYPTGVEFAAPSNYWNRRLVPPGWLPYTRKSAAHSESNNEDLPATRPPRIRVRLRLGRGAGVMKLFSRTVRRQRQCQCCGGAGQLVYVPSENEVVCRPCREFSTAA